MYLDLDNFTIKLAENVLKNIEKSKIYNLKKKNIPA